MRRQIRAVLAKVVVVFLWAWGSQAQEAPACQHRSLVINVRNQEGNLVPGLEPTAFQASLRGEPVKIVSARINADQPRIVLLLDVSGSMNRYMDKVQLLARDFIVSSPKSQVALVTFSDHIVDTLGFERGPEPILEKLTTLSVGQGRTFILESLMYAADLFHGSESGDAVYLISDGSDSRSRRELHEGDVEREFLSKGIRLFFYWIFQTPLFQTVKERGDVDDLKHLAEVTGGSLVNKSHQYATEPPRMGAALGLAYDLMNHFYELEVELPEKLDAEHKWELNIVDQTGKRQKNVGISYPMDFVPCPIRPSILHRP